MIRQRLKDIEIQRWLREINNGNRKDANQSNKMRTYLVLKTIDNYKWEDYLALNSSNKTVTKQPQISHRDRTLFETV